MAHIEADCSIPRCAARRWGWSVLLLLLLLIPRGVMAGDAQLVVSRIDPEDGVAERIPANSPETKGALNRTGSVPIRLREGDRLPVGAQVRTNSHTRLVLFLAPRTRLEIGPGSEVLLTLPKAPSGSLDWLIQQASGWVRATLEAVPGAEQFGVTVDAGNVLAAPKSTDFVVLHTRQGFSAVWVLEGEVRVWTPDDPLGLTVPAAHGQQRLGDGMLTVLDTPPTPVQQILEDARPGGPPGGEHRLGAGLPLPRPPPPNGPIPPDVPRISPDEVPLTPPREATITVTD